MPSDIEKAVELLDQAMETEREGLKAYEEAASKARDPEAKKIFEMLAEAEREHIRVIQDAKEADKYTYASHDWKGQFVSEIGKEIEAIGRQDIPIATDEAASATALEAINMGIKMEQTSIAFYADAQTKVSDLGVANLFGSLLSTERIHLFLLELRKDIITGARRW